MACRRISWWRANNTGRSSGYRWASFVLPSISVKRNVTVPVGTASLPVIDGLDYDREAPRRYRERRGIKERIWREQYINYTDITFPSESCLNYAAKYAPSRYSILLRAL